MKPQAAQMLGVITVAMMTMAGCTNADDSTEPDQHTETSTPSPSNSTTSPRNATSTQDDITPELTAIEDQYDARVGVHAMDTSDGSTIEHRSEERFGFASTIKSLAVAELLARTTPEDLDE